MLVIFWLNILCHGKDVGLPLGEFRLKFTLCHENSEGGFCGSIYFVELLQINIGNKVKGDVFESYLEDLEKSRYVNLKHKFK